MRGSTIKVLIAVLAVLVAGLLLLPRVASPPAPPENATMLPERLELPALSLTDTAGETFTKEALEGRFSLLFFGFTNCPDVCPITLNVLSSAVERIEAADAEAVPQVVFVSVDPYRDTPERIRGYLDGIDASFVGVTGSDEELAPLLDTLGVSVQKEERAGEAYNVVHNSTVYFVGPEARLVAVSSAPHMPETLASDYLAVREWYPDAPEPAMSMQAAPR